MKSRIAMLLFVLAFLVPHQAAAQNVIGVLDIAGDSIGGWALDKSHPGVSVRVEVYISTGIIFRQIYAQNTNGARTDVNNYFHTSGTPGFGVLMPSDVKAGDVVTVLAYAVVNGEYIDLINSPLRTTFAPTGWHPVVTVHFKNGAGMPDDESSAYLFRMGDDAQWEYVSGSDDTGNGRILNGVAKFWRSPSWDTSGNLVGYVSLPCGQYLLMATAKNGQTAFKEFPLCGGDVDLGTLNLNTYPVMVTQVQQQIQGGKITYGVQVDNRAAVAVEIYTVVSTPTPNAAWTTFVTNRENVQAGASTLSYEVNIPRGVPQSMVIGLEVIVTEKGNPFNVLGRTSFQFTTPRQ